MSTTAFGNEDVDVDALFREMVPRLRGALRFAARPDEIEDVVQETFLMMLSGNLRGPARPDRAFGYLVGTASNLLAVRRRENRETPGGGPTELSPVEDDDGGLLADEVVDRVAIRTMISELPGNVRDAALLHADGYEKPAIARYLGVPLSVVGHLLKQFRHALRVVTSPEPGQHPTTWLRDPERDWGAPLPALRPAAAPRSGWERINLAIAQLPPRQREVVARHVYGWLRPREIAYQLGISANSARVNLHHAYVALGDVLGLTKQQIQDIAGRAPHPEYTEPAA